MKALYLAVSLVVAVTAGCSNSRDRDEYMSARDAADSAYVSGTITEVERAQLKLLELSTVAYEGDAKYVESAKVINLAHMRLWNIYTEMGDLEKAQDHLRKSYEWAGDDVDGWSFERWSEGVAELFRQVDENVNPVWKESNKAVEVTPDGAPHF